MDYIKLKSRAKINLVLDVLSKREDGYHELEMIMQSLSLYDSIFIKKTEKNEISLKNNVPYLPEDERNIAYRAASLMRERFNIKQGVHIEITKRIPIAAGLAGGSGNCAAVLKGMNEIFELGLSLRELMKLGSELGSDVPFCLMEGTALAKGRGEILTRLSPCPHFYVVLAKPKIGVSTSFVYQNLNFQIIKDRPDTEKVILAIENEDKDGICKGLCNVLEAVTMKHYPLVLEIKEYLNELGSMGSLMSGSGPTVFGLFDNAMTAEDAAQKLKDKFRIKDVYVTEIQNL